MAFDYKKEYKEFYLPKNKPGIVTIPPMNFIAVRGTGDPRRSIQAVHRPALQNRIHHQDEQTGQPADRGVFRLRGASA